VQKSLLEEGISSGLRVNVIGTIFSVNVFLALIRGQGTKKIMVIPIGLTDLDSLVESGSPLLVTYGATKVTLNVVVAKYAEESTSEGITLLSTPDSRIPERRLVRRRRMYYFYVQLLATIPGLQCPKPLEKR
jgi:hypothetical protein